MTFPEKISTPEVRKNKNPKFANIPLDKDTRIDAEIFTQINGLDAVHQRWFWDGVQGESLIFCTTDLQDISDEMLIHSLQGSMLAGHTDANVSRNESGYTFVNFGFKAEV